MPPVIDASKCKKCGNCTDICPLEVFGCTSGNNKVPVVLYPDECWHCNCCVLDCPAKAINLRVPISHMILHMDSPHLQKIQGGSHASN